MSKIRLLKQGALVFLAVVLVTGTAAACTSDEFDWRFNETEEDASEITSSTTPATDTPDPCVARAYEEWVSGYGYVADRTPDGMVRGIPHPAGFAEFLVTLDACQG